MKTILCTTCWLDNDEFNKRTEKWLRYYIYNSGLIYDNIMLLDNASSFENIQKHSRQWTGNVIIQRFTKHMSRTSHLEYPYLWRAVYFYQELFKEYDKVIYMDNDAYLLSDNAMNYVNNFKNGWASFNCPKHSFPETGIQIITKDCKEYKDFVGNMSEEEFIKKYNGSVMEGTLPLTEVNRKLIGDRYSEYGIIKQDKIWDFSCQTLLETDMIYRKRNG